MDTYPDGGASIADTSLFLSSFFFKKRHKVEGGGADGMKVGWWWREGGIVLGCEDGYNDHPCSNFVSAEFETFTF